MTLTQTRKTYSTPDIERIVQNHIVPIVSKWIYDYPRSTLMFPIRLKYHTIALIIVKPLNLKEESYPKGVTITLPIKLQYYEKDIMKTINQLVRKLNNRFNDKNILVIPL